MCLSGKTILHQNSPATELVLEWEKRKDKKLQFQVFFSKCKIHLFALCNLRYSHKYNLTDFLLKFGHYITQGQTKMETQCKNMEA